MHCWTPELGSSSFLWFCLSSSLTPPPVFISLSGPFNFALSTQEYNFNRMDKELLALLHRCLCVNDLIVRALFWESFITMSFLKFRSLRRIIFYFLNFPEFRLLYKRQYLFLIHISCLYLLPLTSKIYLNVRSNVCITISVERSLTAWADIRFQLIDVKSVLEGFIWDLAHLQSDVILFLSSLDQVSVWFRCTILLCKFA